MLCQRLGLLREWEAVSALQEELAALQGNRQGRVYLTSRHQCAHLEKENNTTLPIRPAEKGQTIPMKKEGRRAEW